MNQRHVTSESGPILRKEQCKEEYWHGGQAKSIFAASTEVHGYQELETSAGGNFSPSVKLPHAGY